MTKLRMHPVTIAGRDHALKLAGEIAGSYPAYYGSVPLPFLALRVRELVRFCEECQIWEPADHTMIVRAMFQPAPACLPEEARDHVLQVLANLDVTAEARARMVALALTEAAPGPRTPLG